MPPLFYYPNSIIGGRKLSDLNAVVAQALQLFSDLQDLKKVYSQKVVQPQPSFSVEEWKEHRENGLFLFKYHQPVVNNGLCLRLIGDICNCIKRNRPEIKEQVDGVSKFLDGVTDGFFVDFLQGEHKVSPLPSSFSPEENDLLNFVVRQAVYPFLEKYVSLLHEEVGDDRWQRSYCPVCGEKANISYLHREDGKRYLICPFCGQEWLYRYLVCSWCGNEDHKSIRYFEVAELPGYEVYLCDQCHSYLKTFNARKATSHDDWVLEDVKTLALDLLAKKEGYEGPGNRLM